MTTEPWWEEIVAAAGLCILVAMLVLVFIP